MLHLLASPTPATPEPYAEALSRLAGVRHVLRLVEPFAGGPADDLDYDEEQIAMALEDAGEAKKRCFDKRTGRVIASTAEGLEALLAERETGREPNLAASQRLADEIRAGIDDVSRFLLGGGPRVSVFTLPDSLPIAL